MIEAARELMDLVKHAPQYTLWVLLGILFYKVFIAGSWIMIARLLIVKVHDYLSRPVEKKVEHKLGNLVIGSEGNVSAIISCLHAVRLRDKGRPSAYVSDYIHDADVVWLRGAIEEKLNQERAELAAKKPGPIEAAMINKL